MVVLRDYQLRAVASIEAGVRRHGRTLAVVFTGAGKTTVMADLVRRWAGRSMLAVHRKELVKDIADRIREVTGDPHSVAVEMAGQRSDESGFLYRKRFVVASIQTVSDPARLARFERDAFSLLLIDEAHHATAPTYRGVIDHFAPAAGVVGVTATPLRADSVGLRNVFPHCAVNLPLTWGVENGWLVPVEQKVVKLDGIDFATFRKSVEGDWSEADMDRQLSEAGPVHMVAWPLTELLAPGEQAIVFCAGVRQAEAVSFALNRYRPGSSRWVCGDTRKVPEKERDSAVAEYRSGRLAYLVNVGCFTEGFDAPSTGWVVIARPTRSFSLYLQMMGRGTRTLGGLVDGLGDVASRVAAIAGSRKPRCVVLDFVGSSGRFDLGQITAADVLGEACGDQVKERAKEIIARRKGGDVKAALAEAAELVQAEIAYAAEKTEWDRRLVADSVSYRVEDAGSIGVGDQRLPAMAEPATDGQRRLLRHLGVPWEKTEKVGKKAAIGWINRLKAEQARGGGGVAG